MSEPLSLTDVVLVTPTYRGDLERFDVLRESIMELEISLPHIVVVDTEDMPVFKKYADQPGVTLLTTADVLTRDIEARRRAAKDGKRRYRRYDPRLYVVPTRVDGWKAQQIVKLAMPQLSTAKVVLAVDSDCFFVRRPTIESLVGESGRPLLIETAAMEAYTTSWLLHAMNALGVPLAGAPVHNYIQCPTILSRSVLVDVQRALGRRSRRGWQQAFLDSRAAEYQLHGVYAALVEKYASVEPTDHPAGVIWWVPDTYRSMADFESAVMSARHAIAAALNSTLRLDADTHRQAARRLRELCADDG